MNRRKFFGMTLAGIVAAGLPELVLPERSIFLPPRLGWHHGLRLRYVEQYDCCNDPVPLRFEVAVIDKHGERFQYGADAGPLRPGEKFSVERHAEPARAALARRLAADGLLDAKQILLPLPRYAALAGYV